jgi:hypothetical protein
MYSPASHIGHYFTIFDTKQGSTQFFIVISPFLTSFITLLSTLKENVIFLSCHHLYLYLVQAAQNIGNTF